MVDFPVSFASNVITPWGNGLSSNTAAQHFLGQKQYELTNQLGNVQVTVSDKRFVKTDSSGQRTGFNASLPAVYDYYPFGQLIPERSVVDKSTQVASITQYQTVPQVLNVSNAFQSGVSAIGSAVLSSPSSSFVLPGIIATGQTGGMMKTITGLTVGAPVTVTLNLSFIKGLVGINITDGSGRSGALLGSQTARSSGIHSLSFTPTSSTATIALNVLVCYTNPNTMLMWVNSVGYSQASGYTLVPTLVQIKSVGDDRYEFGFNGQMKVNEVAGVGNHLDYGARGRDPRLGGGWWSPDQHASRYPGVSPYSFSLCNPIICNDPDGKDVHVTINKNPQGGGGVVQLGTTVFVAGAGAEAIVEASNKAFGGWKSAGGATSDGKWQVQVQMTFKVATAEDVARMKSNAVEQSGDNLLISDLKERGEGSRANAGGRGWAYKASIFTDDAKTKRDMTSGNIGHINSKDGGRTSIHETMHLLGFGDRYSDVTYQYETDGVTNRTGCFSKDHVGFEGDIMNSGWGFSLQHADDIVKKVLDVSSQKGGSTEFDMGRQVDNANKRDAGAVPSSFGEKTKYTNPQQGNCGH